MRTMRWPLVVLIFGYGIAAAAVENDPQTDPRAGMVQPGVPATEVSEPGVDASSVFLPCTPVAAYWTGPPRSEGMPPGPELGIIDFNIRPKDARVHLDDRFVGRARYLDGKPGYLYLAPGPYRLELRLEGYQTVVVDLDVQAGCRYDLKHRLDRVAGTAKVQKAESYGKGEPFNRVYAPVSATEKGAGGRPDLSLRSDVGRKESSGGKPQKAAAAMRIHATPAEASIAIDGSFVATARELSRMEGPLVVSPGSHRIEVSAPGRQSQIRVIDLEEGEVVELSIDLATGASVAR